ncbi:MAG: methyltransferase domain-containing protein [Terriglobales bacterium]
MSVAMTIGVRESYELWAPEYARHANPLLTLQERALEPLIPPLRGKRFVDVACGTGRWLKRLESRGSQSAIGLDLSTAMLRQAQDGVRHSVALLCADGCALPLRDRCADIVLCSLALDHVTNLAAMIYELARIADNGGVLLLSDFHPDAHARGWKRSFKVGERTIDLPVHPRHLSTIHDALRHAGFRLELCEEPCFSELDRPAFRAAGREDLFLSATHAGPALYAARYVRRNRAMTVAPARADFLARSATVATSARSTTHGNVTVTAGVFSTTESRHGAAALDLSGYMVLPGLINAHDHLEFSLYPRLGTGPYPSARHWAKDIYHPDESPIREHRGVPKDIRLWWGGLKNLLCGVTTVAHHNPYAPVFARPQFPVRVVEHYGWAHSFAEEPDVRARFDGTPGGSPFFIHLGEGTDAEAKSEFSMVADIGALDSRTVVVHGVALRADEHERLQQCGGAIVWCPSSNLFLLGQTVSPQVLNGAPRVALGSDSAISGDGDLLDEIRSARGCGVSAERIYALVTGLGANVLNSGSGSVSNGVSADFIAVRDRGLSPAETLCRATHADVELVMIAGKLRLISDELLERWQGAVTERLELIVVNGVRRHVAAPVAHLLAVARRHLGPDIRLAGKRVWQ